MVEQFCAQLLELYTCVKEEEISLNAQRKFLSISFGISGTSTWPSFLCGENLQKICILIKKKQFQAIPLLIQVLETILETVSNPEPQILSDLIKHIGLPFFDSKDFSILSNRLLAKIFLLIPKNPEILPLLKDKPSSPQFCVSILSEYKNALVEVPDLIWEISTSNFQNLLATFLSNQISGQNAKLAKSAKLITDFIEVAMEIHKKSPKHSESFIKTSIRELLDIILNKSTNICNSIDSLFRFSIIFQNSIHFFNIYENEAFWNVLSNGVSIDQMSGRRQCMFLFKGFIQHIHSNKLANINIDHWNEKQWNSYFVIFDTLEESKSHLFVPVWVDFKCLCQFQDQASSMKYEWLSSLIQRGLNHTNFTIKKIVVESTLTLDEPLLTYHFSRFSCLSFSSHLFPGC